MTYHLLFDREPDFFFPQEDKTRGLIKLQLLLCFFAHTYLTNYRYLE